MHRTGWYHVGASPYQTVDYVTIRIEKFGINLALLSPFESASLARALPDGRYWKPDYGEGQGAWILAPSAANIGHLEAVFPHADWTDFADNIRLKVHKQKDHADLLRSSRKKEQNADDFKFRMDPPPFAHQVQVFSLNRDLAEYALFMEQGTGKTRIMIDTATDMRAKGNIDAVLVICPNSVKEVWIEEVPLMAPPWSEHEMVAWSAVANRTQRDRINDFILTKNEGASLKWFGVNGEGLSSERAGEACESF